MNGKAINALVGNPRLQLLLIALLLVTGLAALSTLPRTEDPRVQNRIAVTLTPFPGATAERVEALVTEPIENKLRELPEINTISSKSQPGLSVITIELKDEITDTTPVWSRARDKLADVQAELPTGALPSRFDDERGYAFTQVLALRWAGAGGHRDERRLAILKRYAEELQTRLRGVAGTDLVELFGEPSEEIRVTLDPQRASALGLTPAAVAAAVDSADAKVAAGTLRNADNQLLVEVAGELDTLERVRQIPLRVTADGDTVRLHDIASVERGVQTPAEAVVLSDGQPAVVVAARMLPDLRIDRWSQWMEQTLNDFRAELPGNVELSVLFDQGRYTDQRLGGLLGNVLLGFGLIVTVLLLTLGWRAALIVACALPLTVLFTLACMRLYGLPIHQMSVTGLVVALGIMVDNAIVMVDAIQRRRREGMAALAAVLESVRHYWLPLAGSTLTTVLAFAPIAVMPGPAGEFVGGIALSVMFALAGSYLISHTLIAGLAGRYVGAANPGARRWHRDGLCLPWLTRGFRASLRFSLRRPLLSVLAVGVVPVAGFLAAGTLTEQFFPPADRDMFHVELRLAPQTSIEGTRREVAKVDTLLGEYPELQAVNWFIGDSAPPFYYNMQQNQDGTPYFAQAMITASDFQTANRLIPELQRRLDDALPGSQTLVRKLEQGPPFNAPLEVRLYGPDLTTLRALGERLRQIMLATEDVIHSRMTLADGAPKVWLQTRDEITQQTGLPLTGVARQLQAALDGALGGSLLEGTEELPVRVRIGAAERAQLSDLAALDLATPGNGPAAGNLGRFDSVSLAALGGLELRPTLGTVPRRNGQRVNTVEGFIRADVLPETVLQRFQQNLATAGLELPTGYRLEYGGESAERDQAVGNLLASVGVILTLLIVVVVLSFNSFRLSALIFAVAGQSAGLGLLSVYAFGYPFGFTVIIGLLGLMGLAINAAIVILAELRSDPRAASGDLEAISDGVMSTTRHIFSTTVTTVGGFLPLILAPGGFWPPFAVAIAGGTVLTTLLSFYFVPTVFRWLARRRSFAIPQEENADADPVTPNNEPIKPISSGQRALALVGLNVWPRIG